MSDQFELEPLKISCTAYDCEHELHCFKFQSKKMPVDARGHCRGCGAALVAWERVHKRDSGDVEYTFESLRRELIRHHFWHKKIDEKAELHARRKGRRKLEESVPKRLRSSIGAAQPFRDGQQTSMEGNIIHYAQHATACCCRTCLEYWHAIPKGKELTVQEIDYLTELVLLYIAERMPDLASEPERIPRRPHAIRVPYEPPEY